MPRPKLSLNMPIRVRLTLAFTLLLMLSLVGLGVVLYFVVSVTLDNRLQSSLQGDADYTLVDNAHHPDAALLLPGMLKNPDDNSPLLNSAGETRIVTKFKADPDKINNSVIIYDENGNVLAQTQDGLKNDPKLVNLALSIHTRSESAGQFSHLKLPNYSNNNAVEPFVIYTRPIFGLSDPTNEQSQPKLLAIYLDSRPYVETSTLLDTMRGLLLIGVPVALLISLLVSFFVAGRALHPIKAIITTARQIGATDLNRRIGLKTQDELGQLAQTFDQMIERLEGSFSRQKRFVADASHELRTPLTVIEAEATLMLKRERDVQDYQRALDLIAQESGRMRRLIDDMLTLARVDSGEIELVLQTIALDDLAIEAMERIGLLTRQKNQHLQLEAEEIWLQGDPEVLLGLMVNLLSNAVKYTSDDGVIRVRVMRIGTNQAVFEVQDTGPGIAPEHLAHVFDRFYQVDRARKRQVSAAPEARPNNSSGLGLSIAQWAAEAHGGHIEVRSVLGQGTIFTVFLPVNTTTNPKILD